MLKAVRFLFVCGCRIILNWTRRTFWWRTSLLAFRQLKERNQLVSIFCLPYDATDEFYNYFVIILVISSCRKSKSRPFACLCNRIVKEMLTVNFQLNLIIHQWCVMASIQCILGEGGELLSLTGVWEGNKASAFEAQKAESGRWGSWGGGSKLPFLPSRRSGERWNLVKLETSRVTPYNVQVIPEFQNGENFEGVKRYSHPDIFHWGERLLPSPGFTPLVLGCANLPTLSSDI